MECAPIHPKEMLGLRVKLKLESSLKHAELRKSMFTYLPFAQGCLGSAGLGSQKDQNSSIDPV